jgi:hypothetical protein
LVHEEQMAWGKRPEKQKSRVSFESPALLPHKEEKGVSVVYLPMPLGTVRKVTIWTQTVFN